MEASGCPEPQQLYDDAPCGLMLADTSGRLLRVNGTICRWLGYRPDELLGMSFRDLLTVGGRIFYQTHLGPLLRMQGSVAEVKLELRLRDGEAIRVMVNLAEGSAGGGQTVVHIAAFAATDRHRYERELLAERRRAEDLAAQYAKAQGELAACPCPGRTSREVFRTDGGDREPRLAQPALGHQHELGAARAGEPDRRSSRRSSRASIGP